MKAVSAKCGEKLSRGANGTGWRLWLGVLMIALGTTSCVTDTGRPSVADLRSKDRRNLAVVLIRVVTEIDGENIPAFWRADWDPYYSIWLGLGSFFSGGKLEQVPQRFFSEATRLDGWTYLLLEPGIYYLSPQPPISEVNSTNAKTPPRWHFQVPQNVPVIYIGTLFVPGRGHKVWLLPKLRVMQVFDEERFAVRDESGLADNLYQAWLKHLGPITNELVKPSWPSEPIILETPPGR